jgi:hypothetical protein
VIADVLTNARDRYVRDITIRRQNDSVRQKKKNQDILWA